MAYWDDFIYTNPLLECSLDASVADARSPIHELRSNEDDPETALIKAQELAHLTRWAARLPPDLKTTASAAMAGVSQAVLSRRLNLSEAAVSKRMTRLKQRGRADLALLHRSVFLH